MLKLTEKEMRALSLSRAIEAAAGPGLAGTFEGEVQQDLARALGRTYDPNRLAVPWEWLGKRDMTAAGASGSNYLVGNDHITPADTLRGYNVVLQAGATLLPDRVGNISIPRTVTDATAYWLADEASAITAGQPEVGMVSMTPKTLGALVTVSHQLRVTTEVDAFLRGHLLQTIGRTLDAAVLAGSGIAGEPTGLVNVPGVHAESGTSLAWSGLQNMLQHAADGGADDEALGWIGAPDTRELLASRERFTGTGPCWAGREMAGFSAVAAKAAPSASLFLGPWREIVIALWGVPEIEVNPGSLFKSGKVQMRVLMQADVACRHPAAFAMATSIT